MKYTVEKIYSFSFERKRYMIHPGDKVELIQDHLPDNHPFGDKAKYKVFRDSEGREFTVFSGDYNKFKLIS